MDVTQILNEEALEARVWGEWWRRRERNLSRCSVVIGGKKKWNFTSLPLRKGSNIYIHSHTHTHTHTHTNTHTSCLIIHSLMLFFTLPFGCGVGRWRGEGNNMKRNLIYFLLKTHSMRSGTFLATNTHTHTHSEWLAWAKETLCLNSHFDMKQPPTSQQRQSAKTS